MNWHVANKSEDGMMKGPVDSKTWQIVEDRWPQFKKEPKHLRLGLATNGVNLYFLQQSKYLVWPIVVLNYNLPPHLTMSNAFMWFAFIVLGRRHVHNMDIYLQPLINELQLLWMQGVLVIDVSKPTTNQLLIMNAILLWTLHDYPGLGVMSNIFSSCTFRVFYSKCICTNPFL